MAALYYSTSAESPLTFPTCLRLCNVFSFAHAPYNWLVGMELIYICCVLLSSPKITYSWEDFRLLKDNTAQSIGLDLIYDQLVCQPLVKELQCAVDLLLS